MSGFEKEEIEAWRILVSWNEYCVEDLNECKIEFGGC
jgi:hypothetical protein